MTKNLTRQMSGEDIGKTFKTNAGRMLYAGLDQDGNPIYCELSGNHVRVEIYKKGAFSRKDKGIKFTERPITIDFYRNLLEVPKEILGSKERRVA